MTERDRPHRGRWRRVTETAYNPSAKIEISLIGAANAPVIDLRRNAEEEIRGWNC